MCCCNSDRPEIYFVTEDNRDVNYEGMSLDETPTEYEVLSVSLYSGWDQNTIRFTVRPKDAES